MKIQLHYKIIFFFLFIFSSLMSQEIKLSWTDRVNYDNKTNGFLAEIIGSTLDNVYVLHNFYGFNPMKKVRLIAYDKKTMRIQNSISLKGFDKKTIAQSLLKELEFFDAVTTDSTILVFWTRISKQEHQLIFQIYDINLRLIQDMTIIDEVKLKKHPGNTPFFIVNSNPITIGHTDYIQEAIVVSYKTINKENALKKNVFSIPLEKTNLEPDFSYIESSNKVFYVVRNQSLNSFVSGTNTVYNYTPDFANKKIISLKYLFTDSSVRLSGFYSDLFLDKKGEDIHGVFYQELNNQLAIKVEKFNPFTKGELDNVFKNDISDRKDMSFFKKKTKKASEEVSLPTNYQIEQTLTSPTNTTIFCARMNNYSTTTCSGSTGCVTNYYCEKENITTISLNREGTIEWITNIDRYKKYSSWNVKDLNAIFLNDTSFLITYGSTVDPITKYSKSKNDLINTFEYVTLNQKNGSYKINKQEVNSIGVKNRDKKIIKPQLIEAMNNELYFIDQKRYVHPLVYLTFVVPPVFIVLLLSSTSKRGRGNIGVLRK
jgi:hypothetical protein